MFTDSQRIVVIESNITSKETGPRKGSIGYIINSNQKYMHTLSLLYYKSHIVTLPLVPPNAILTPSNFVSMLNSNMLIFRHKQITYYCIACDVVFTRFGFEKKKRIELKKIINVFPVITNFNKKIPLQLLNKEVIKDLKTIMPNIPTIVIMAPCLEKIDSFIDDFTELQAWIESILKNDLFKLLLFKNVTLFNNILLIKSIKNKLDTMTTTENNIKLKIAIPKIEELLSLYDNNKMYLISDLRKILIYLNTVTYHVEKKGTYASELKVLFNVWQKKAVGSITPEIRNTRKHLHNLARNIF